MNSVRDRAEFICHSFGFNYLFDFELGPFNGTQYLDSLNEEKFDQKVEFFKNKENYEELVLKLKNKIYKINSSFELESWLKSLSSQEKSTDTDFTIEELSQVLILEDIKRFISLNQKMNNSRFKKILSFVFLRSIEKKLKHEIGFEVIDNPLSQPYVYRNTTTFKQRLDGFLVPFKIMIHRPGVITPLKVVIGAALAPIYCPFYAIASCSKFIGNQIMGYGDEYSLDKAEKLIKKNFSRIERVEKSNFKTSHLIFSEIKCGGSSQSKILPLNLHIFTDRGNN